MGPQGLEIVRFYGRYYIYFRYHEYDDFPETLGAEIVASIPDDPKEYKKWLKAMRDEYAAKENDLERHVYEIRDGSKPDYSKLRQFKTPPSEFPRLSNDAEFVYLINLDQQVLTMNHSVHWKLGNIPRQNKLWFRAMVGSIHRGKPTISLDLCQEKHIASPALDLPQREQEIGYDSRVVTSKTDLAEARKTFFMHVLASTLIEYKEDIIRFGMEWSSDALPFRELAFALVSIASGQSSFHSFPAQQCDPRICDVWGCKSYHVRWSPGWLDEKLVDNSAPLLKFGSLCHRTGKPSGASPTETMHWLEDVLVSLAPVTDGKAITKAVAWGIEQGRANFLIVILSLFKALFAEVSLGHDKQPFVRVSDPINLSPLRADYCVSTHSRMRPELKAGMKSRRRRGETIMNSNCTVTRRKLRTHFPGLAALVNFFEVAGNRRAASKSRGTFPLELYDRILDFVDYGTWKTCLLVSTAVRSLCLRKYRLDDRTRIVAGPFVRLPEYSKHRVVSFNFENMHTGKILPMMWAPHFFRTEKYNWMPVIGRGHQKALMLDVVVQFEPAKHLPVEADSDDGCG
ncbi:hypothetical protein BJX62DRAFT_248573 [Aspergillus germanicus]